jgi:Effector-associated domain 10/NACHT domain
MSDKQNLNAIFDRIAKRGFTDEDIQTLRQSIVASVAIGGNADGTTIATGNDNIIGDNNTVQIGKYNINIAEGSNIKVGDTTYQGADAETIRSILLEVVTDKIVIDSAFSRLFGKSESSGVDWDWGMKLLKQKQLPEIRKRLTDTLGRDRILMDVSIEEHQNWVNRSLLAADRTLQINGKDCGTLDANKMLIETFGRDDIERKLLILGAPGSGKTTALLSLAEQLVEGAISQPGTVLPVIFELSTWQNEQEIRGWLIEQLYDLHGGNRKSKLYDKWLDRQVLLPLLDGLDELGLERQRTCTEKLNKFAEDYPQLVVCCRVTEFEAVDIKLRNLRGAVCLQSLSDSQIQHYFDSLHRPELWEAIQTTPSLQTMLEPMTEGDSGLLRVPLFVKLVADVYDPPQPISGKADLLDKYIDRQLSFDKRDFDRRKELKEYKWAYKTVKLEPDWKKTRSSLIWIARNLQANNKVEFRFARNLQANNEPEFRIERIQISYLPNHEKFATKLIHALLVALLFGSAMGTIVGIIVFILFLLITGIATAGVVSLIISLFVGIFTGLWAFLTIGQSNDIYPVEKLESSFPSLIKSFIIAIPIAFVSWGIVNIIIYPWKASIPILTSLETFLTIAPLLVIIFGIKAPELKQTNKPNDGIWRSLKNAFRFALTGGIWLTLCSFFLREKIFTFLLQIGLSENRKSSLIEMIILISLSMVAGLLFGLTQASTAVIQHLSLRIILWKSGLPWNFAQFLNYCVERRLLLRVGGSYRFLHRELLDHFAQLNH